MSVELHLLGVMSLNISTALPNNISQYLYTNQQVVWSYFRINQYEWCGVHILPYIRRGSKRSTPTL